MSVVGQRRNDEVGAAKAKRPRLAPRPRVARSEMVTLLPPVVSLDLLDRLTVQREVEAVALHFFADAQADH
jgi:hypothetical protein